MASRSAGNQHREASRTSHNLDHYDHTDRKGPKVYLGEYGSWDTANDSAYNPTNDTSYNSTDDTTNNAAKHTGKTRNSNYTKRRKEKNSSINW